MSTFSHAICGAFRKVPNNKFRICILKFFPVVPEGAGKVSRNLMIYPALTTLMGKITGLRSVAVLIEISKFEREVEMVASVRRMRGRNVRMKLL